MPISQRYELPTQSDMFCDSGRQDEVAEEDMHAQEPQCAVVLADGILVPGQWGTYSVLSSALLSAWPEYIYFCIGK